MSDVPRLPLGPCPVCHGSGHVTEHHLCGFCNGRGQVPTVIVADADFDQIAMHMTGTKTIEDAERALAKGPPA